MKRVALISGFALIVCIAFSALDSLVALDPRLRSSSATGTRDGLVLEGEVFYERGLFTGVANYSISKGWKNSSSDRILDSIKSGETVPSEIEWSVEWSELAGNYIAAWILVGLISWWWNQKEPHHPENPNQSEQSVSPKSDRAGG